MKDFFKFRKMITPIIIPILFWIGTIVCIIVGFVNIILGMTFHLNLDGENRFLAGLAYFFLGPIIIRIYCEFLIILFSVNDKLADIKDILQLQKNSQVDISNQE